MPRPLRRDVPGDWFHVMNRAVGRRLMFENGVDIRRFLARIGEAVARGWIEVHAFAVLGTHFHLLARSPCGAMSSALHLIQSHYSWHFNRTRDRDGPLVRGRYVAKLVDSANYRRVLVGYIDQNAPRAGLCTDAPDYPFASARAYLRGGGPPWLCRDWVEAEVAAATASRTFTPRGYFETFLSRFGDGQFAFVERRIADRTPAPDPTDALLAGGPPAVLDWVTHRARLADGVRSGTRLAPPEVIAATGAIDREPERTAFLLREVAGLTLEEAARLCGVSIGAVRRRHHAAKRRIGADAAFAGRVSEHVLAALRATNGGKNVPGT